MLLDYKGDMERFISDLKSRIVASRPEEFPTMFPEWMPKKDTAKEIELGRQHDGTYDIDKIDDTKVEWSSPATEAENEENERWLAERLATHGTISATELEEGGWI